MSKSDEDWNDARQVAIEARQLMYDALDKMDCFPFSEVGEDAQRKAGEHIEVAIRRLNEIIGECTKSWIIHSTGDIHSGSENSSSLLRCPSCATLNHVSIDKCTSCQYRLQCPCGLRHRQGMCTWDFPVNRMAKPNLDVTCDSNAVRETNITCTPSACGEGECTCDIYKASMEEDRAEIARRIVDKRESAYLDLCGNDGDGSPEERGIVHDDIRHEGRERWAGRCKGSCRKCFADAIDKRLKEHEAAYEALSEKIVVHDDGCKCPVCCLATS